jgi:hypothetical protein
MNTFKFEKREMITLRLAPSKFYVHGQQPHFGLRSNWTADSSKQS